MTREQLEDQALAAAGLRRDTPRAQVCLALVERVRLLYEERRARWEGAPSPKAKRDRLARLVALLTEAEDILRDAGPGDPFARKERPNSIPTAVLVGQCLRLPNPAADLITLESVDEQGRRLTSWDASLTTEDVSDLDPLLLIELVPATVQALRDAAAIAAARLDAAGTEPQRGRPTSGARDEALRMLAAVFWCVHVREDEAGRAKHRDDFLRAAGDLVLGDGTMKMLTGGRLSNILAGAHDPVGLSGRPASTAEGVLDFDAHAALRALTERDAFEAAALRPLADRLGHHAAIVASHWVD